MESFVVFCKKIFGQKAQGMVEYALVLAFLIAVAAYFLSSSNAVGQAVNSSMDGATQQMTQERE